MRHEKIWDPTENSYQNHLLTQRLRNNRKRLELIKPRNSDSCRKELQICEKKGWWYCLLYLWEEGVVVLFSLRWSAPFGWDLQLWRGTGRRVLESEGGNEGSFATIGKVLWNQLLTLGSATKRVKKFCWGVANRIEVEKDKKQKDNKRQTEKTLFTFFSFPVLHYCVLSEFNRKQLANQKCRISPSSSWKTIL